MIEILHSAHLPSLTNSQHGQTTLKTLEKNARLADVIAAHVATSGAGSQQLYIWSALTTFFCMPNFKLLPAVNNVQYGGRPNAFHVLDECPGKPSVSLRAVCAFRRKVSQLFEVRIPKRTEW